MKVHKEKQHFRQPCQQNKQNTTCSSSMQYQPYKTPDNKRIYNHMFLLIFPKRTSGIFHQGRSSREN